MTRKVQEVVTGRLTGVDTNELSTPELVRLTGAAAAAAGGDEAIVAAAGPAEAYTAADFMAALGVNAEIAEGIVASVRAQTAAQAAQEQ
jgi:hypothetical protein